VLSGQPGLSCELSGTVVEELLARWGDQAVLGQFAIVEFADNAQQGLRHVAAAAAQLVARRSR
jgi:hypothetical protein